MDAVSVHKKRADFEKSARKQTRHEKRTRNSSVQLGFCLHGGFASLFDDVAHGIGWLSSFGDPVVSFFHIEGEVDTVFHGVIATDLLDITSVAAFAAVNGNDLVKRTILGALAVESESKHGKKWVEPVRRGGKLYDERRFAKRKIAFLSPFYRFRIFIVQFDAMNSVQPGGHSQDVYRSY